MSRQTIAISVKASKLTARALAYVIAAVGRKIAKEHRKAQTPHGSTDGNGLPVYFVEVSRDVVHRLPEGGVDGAGEADDGLHDLVSACHQCHQSPRVSTKGRIDWRDHSVSCSGVQSAGTMMVNR